MLRKLKNAFHFLEAMIASLFFRVPPGNLVVIGVTGTDGKTTTASLIEHILTASGRSTGLLSTLSSVHATTPGRGAVHKFLQKIFLEGKKYAVMEVTSIAADQFRVWGIKFDIGVLTNVAYNEHLDYHGSFENYKRSKINWLLTCKTVVTNVDDPATQELISRAKGQKLVTYGIKNPADITPKTLKYTTELLGEFNQYNILASVAVCRELGLSDREIARGIANFVAPSGRLEIIAGKPFTVIVDFAHTPQAFTKVLPVAREMLKARDSKLIHVFGATGDRDKGKRPVMAGVAAKYDDYIFLTHEDTYSEDPNAIMTMLEEGLKHAGYSRYQKEFSREEAIKKAINMAKPGDVVLLTGVGHQKSMNIAGREVPWSEQETVRKLLGYGER